MKFAALGLILLFSLNFTLCIQHNLLGSITNELPYFSLPSIDG